MCRREMRWPARDAPAGARCARRSLPLRCHWPRGSPDQTRCFQPRRVGRGPGFDSPGLGAGPPSPRRTRARRSATSTPASTPSRRRVAVAKSGDRHRSSVVTQRYCASAALARDSLSAVGASPCARSRGPQLRLHRRSPWPNFVRDEIEAFLRCGVLAHGFALFRCPTATSALPSASAARAEVSVRAARAGAWHPRRRIWWTTSFPRPPRSGSGSSRSRSSSERGSPSTANSSAPSAAPSWTRWWTGIG